MSNKSRTTRELLCEAAIETAARDGLLSMTLDNVARQAGVSKGGVMYHFPTKDKLLEAVVELFGQRLEQMILERVAADPEPRNRWARAMLDCTFPERSADFTAPHRLGQGKPPATSELFDPVAMERFFLAVLAAAVSNPGLIIPLRGVAQRIQRRILEDPQGGFDQLLVWLALDGLLLWQFAGVLDRDDPLFLRIGAALRARTGLPPSGEPATDSLPDSPPTAKPVAPPVRVPRRVPRRSAP